MSENDREKKTGKKFRLSIQPGIVVLLTSAIAIGLVAIGIVFFLTGCVKRQNQDAKYVFVFMGDGMGINQVTATRYWEAEEKGKSSEELIWKKESFDGFPITGFMTTHNLERSVTDSAASATAIFSGKKTCNRSINYNPDTGESYEPWAKKLSEAGYSVGVISTTALEHASPAAVYASAEERYDYPEIARQGIKEGYLDFWGAGGFVREEESLLAEAEENGFTIADSLEEFHELTADSIPVLAVSKDQYADPFMAYEIDRARSESFGGETISFADMVSKAISCLESKDKFFLFAEAGKIDTACAKCDLVSTLYEVKGLDDAVAQALEFYKKHPEETLIVVLADHETGGLRIRSNMDCSKLSEQVASYARFETIMAELYEANAPFLDAMEKAEHYFGISKDELTEEEKTDFESAYEKSTEGVVYEGELDPFTYELCRYKAKEAKIEFASSSHSGQPVPVYAIGRNAELFSGLYDNTDIYEKLCLITGLSDK